MNQSSTHGKEARRLQAWQLKQTGWSQRQIVAAVGVNEGAVSVERLPAYAWDLIPGDGL